MRRDRAQGWQGGRSTALGWTIRRGGSEAEAWCGLEWGMAVLLATCNSRGRVRWSGKLDASEFRLEFIDSD